MRISDWSSDVCSSDLLISEGHHDGLPTPGKKKDSVVAHLDKSHITVPTYPVTHPDNGISTFRADIDVSTCGKISPLKALNYLITSDRTSVVYGQSVDVRADRGGCSMTKKKQLP